MAVPTFKSADGRFVANTNGWRYDWQLPLVKKSYTVDHSKVDDLLDRLIEADIKLLAVKNCVLIHCFSTALLSYHHFPKHTHVVTRAP